MYTLLYVGYWLKETVLKSPNVWLHPSTRLYKATWSTIVALFSSDMRLCPWPLLPLPLFCLCALPPCILTPLLPLGCWPWSFPGCSSIVRICNSCVVLCLYMLSNWRFMRCTFQKSDLSLIDLHSLHWWKLRFTCTIHGKFTKSLIEMCRKYAWQFMTTRSTILHLMTYTMNQWLDILTGNAIAQKTI